MARRMWSNKHKANATHNHDTDYYKKSEIDLMLGDIESALDAILGV